MSTQNERLLAALSAAEKHSESIGEREWFSAEALSDFGKPFISPSDARFIAECSPQVVRSLLSRIAQLEKRLSTYPADWEKDSSFETWFPLTAEQLSQQQSRIDALSKDAERYHKIKMFMHVDPDVGDDEYHATPGLCIAYDRICDATHIKAWGEQSEMIDAAIDTLPAIDAAISAREGE